jgi:hypothetical protein
MATTPDDPAAAPPGRPPVVDLVTWQAARDELLVYQHMWFDGAPHRGSARAAPPRPDT